jgi:hypothetical protein
MTTNNRILLLLNGAERKRNFPRKDVFHPLAKKTNFFTCP